MEHCCQICYEDFGKKDKKQVECEYCDIGCCSGCVKIHILSLPGEPSCPACKNIWNMDFCQGELTQKFMNKEYKLSRMELMFKSDGSRPCHLKQSPSHGYICICTYSMTIAVLLASCLD